MKTAINIFQQHGLTKLYLGYRPTFLRESIGLTIYFTVYELLTRWMSPNPKNVTMSNALLAGGTAGVFTWLFTYPLDFVKTLIQTDSIAQPRHNSMMGYLR